MKSVLKELVKRVILPVLYRIGMFDLLVRMARRKFVIVMYHGVNPTSDDFRVNPRHIRLKDFERHLTFFKRNFDVIPLLKLAEGLGRSEVPARKILAITFDDGYKNNLHACEMARAHGTPMTIFVGTAVVAREGTMHFADELDFIIHAATEKELSFRGRTYSLSDQKSRRAAGRFVYEQMKPEGTDGKAAILRELGAALRPDRTLLDVWREFFTYLNAEDVRGLRENEMVEIGSHGVDHNNMEYLGPTELERQLVESKRYLEDLLGGKVRCMSYPDGSYNAETIRHVRKHYQVACAVNPRIDRSGWSISELGRFGFSADDDFYVQLFHLVKYLWRKDVRFSAADTAGCGQWG